MNQYTILSTSTTSNDEINDRNYDERFAIKRVDQIPANKFKRAFISLSLADNYDCENTFTLSPTAANSLFFCYGSAC